MNLNDFVDPLKCSTSRSIFSLILCSISTSIGWIGTTSCTDIHGSQSMCPGDFGNPLTKPSGATMRLTFVDLSEMSRQLCDGLELVTFSRPPHDELF